MVEWVYVPQSILPDTVQVAFERKCLRLQMHDTLSDCHASVMTATSPTDE